MAKLMVGVRRFLLLYAVVPTLLAGIAAQPAHAKLGPISIRSVYTTDENQNNKTVSLNLSQFVEDQNGPAIEQNHPS